MSDDAKHVFQAVVMTALADGKYEPAEARMVTELVRLDPGFAAIVDPQTVAQDIALRFRRDGLEACLAGIARGISAPAERERAFRLCAQVMGVDGETSGEEALLLGTMQELFGFSNEDVRRLITAR